MKKKKDILKDDLQLTDIEPIILWRKHDYFPFTGAIRIRANGRRSRISHYSWSSGIQENERRKKKKKELRGLRLERQRAIHMHHDDAVKPHTSVLAAHTEMDQHKRAGCRLEMRGARCAVARATGSAPAVQCRCSPRSCYNHHHHRHRLLLSFSCLLTPTRKPYTYTYPRNPPDLLQPSFYNLTFVKLSWTSLPLVNLTHPPLPRTSCDRRRRVSAASQVNSDFYARVCIPVAEHSDKN